MAKLTGKIVYIYPSKTLTSKNGNAYQKRDFVIAMQSFDRDTGEPTIDENNTPQLSLIGDRCSQLDGVNSGDTVTVDFFLRGTRFRGEDGKEKIINDVNVTSVRVTSRSATAPASMPQAAPESTSAPDPGNKDKNEDLPF